MVRDFASHQFHVATAAVALLLAPLGVAGGEVALGILMAVSIARARELWPVWLDAVRSPIAAAFSLFTAWMLLSLVWSADPRNGADHIQCMRALVWAPLLYPLLGDIRTRVWLLCALLLGITVLALTQAWQWIAFEMSGAEALSQLPRFGGLHGEVGKAGLWAGAGVCIGAFLSVSPHLPRVMRIAVAAAMLCCLAGLCACATLRAMGGTAFGLVIAAAVSMAATQSRSRPHRAWVILPVAVALAGLLLGADRRWDATADRQVEAARAGLSSAHETPEQQRTMPRAASEQAPHDGRLADAGAEAVSDPLRHVPGWLLALDSLPPRILWWRASWHAFLQHPVVGRGWGATPTIVSEYPGGPEFAAQNPQVLAQHPGLLSPSQPHSLYLMTLSEFGGVGAALLVAVVVLVARNCVRAARCCVELGGLAAATALWFVAAGGDTVFNAAVLAAGAIFMAFTTKFSPQADQPPMASDRLPAANCHR